MSAPVGSEGDIRGTRAAARPPALSASHQRMAYELSQIVPLAVIIVAGVVFYGLGRPTRQDVATEPVTASIGPAEVADRAT